MGSHSYNIRRRRAQSVDSRLTYRQLVRMRTRQHGWRQLCGEETKKKLKTCSHLFTSYCTIGLESSSSRRLPNRPHCCRRCLKHQVCQHLECRVLFSFFCLIHVRKEAFLSFFHFKPLCNRFYGSKSPLHVICGKAPGHHQDEVWRLLTTSWQAPVPDGVQFKTTTHGSPSQSGLARKVS